MRWGIGDSDVDDGETIAPATRRVGTAMVGGGPV
jgi:hypothetical protein